MLRGAVYVADDPELFAALAGAARRFVEEQRTAATTA